MRRSSVVLVAVLIAGYTLYPGLLVAATAIHDSLSGDAPSVQNGSESSVGPGLAGGPTGGDPFRFVEIDGGLDYEYVFVGPNYVAPDNAGVYVADYNRDGWADVLAIGGERPVLFQNVGGEFEPSGALPNRLGRGAFPGRPMETRTGQIQGALWVDYNVDGWPDLVLLPKKAPPILLANTGGGFELQPSAFNWSLVHPMGATTADYNRDGCPDLFVYQMGDWVERAPRGQTTNFSGPINNDNGNPDYLYWGTCGGFALAGDAGLSGARWTLAASSIDLTGDGYPDIHQANDFTYDVVYRNQQNGRFEQVVLPDRTNRNGMSSEVADVTGNGRPDVFVTNIYYPDGVAARLNPGLRLRASGNNLISRLPGGAYVDRAAQYNVTRGGWGWAAVIADFDNDGDEDLFHTTRSVRFNRRDSQLSNAGIARLDAPYYSYPAVWERTSGPRFSPMDPKSAGFTQTNGRGAARFDYDNDGDSDLIIAGTDAYRIYENRVARRNSIQVRVLGTNGSQTAAFGATVSVVLEGRTLTRRVHARTDFHSQDSRLVHLGVGNASRVDIRVVWPDNTELRLENQAVGQRLVVTPDDIVRTANLAGP